MKKAGVFLFLVFCLSGCSTTPKEMERGMEIRTRLLQAEGCSFCVDITADYGDKIHTFAMSCQADQEGNLDFEVIQPQSISGISGSIDEKGGKLTFDGTALHFPLLADDQITPVSAPWIFLKTLRSGYMTSACMEDGFLRLTIDDSYEEDALTLDIWVNDADAPVRAEILYDGRRILSLIVKEYGIS